MLLIHFNILLQRYVCIHHAAKPKAQKESSSWYAIDAILLELATPNHDAQAVYALLWPQSTACGLFEPLPDQLVSMSTGCSRLRTAHLEYRLTTVGLLLKKNKPSRDGIDGPFQDGPSAPVVYWTLIDSDSDIQGILGWWDLRQVYRE
ncbi:hypothetical protein CROQUDRAFT_96649 [Cronartium quercuum f. sp. fusiforme G11]|uniref:Uncharacterized protein n=1 Tax=Cronartium quercuum f. sp. fusiforme G11 TaxID=708437 RepID=A0A9P6NCP1_9BASI|nr:hypothetical protein CROQUDRAFT_96649 [Cronartium quercuum f. sp. fusiforme G11]